MSLWITAPYNIIHTNTLSFIQLCTFRCHNNSSRKQTCNIARGIPNKLHFWIQQISIDILSHNVLFIFITLIFSSECNTWFIIFNLVAFILVICRWSGFLAGLDYLTFACWYMYTLFHKNIFTSLWYFTKLYKIFLKILSKMYEQLVQLPTEQLISGIGLSLNLGLVLFFCFFLVFCCFLFLFCFVLCFVFVFLLLFFFCFVCFFPLLLFYVLTSCFSAPIKIKDIECCCFFFVLFAFSPFFFFMCLPPVFLHPLK